MEERRRLIDRVVMVGAVIAMVAGLALLSTGFTAFRTEPRPHAVVEPAEADEPIVITTAP